MEKLEEDDIDPNKFLSPDAGDDNPDEEKKIPGNPDVPEDDDLIEIIKKNSQKEEVVFPEGEDFNHIECFLKKIKLPEINKEQFKPEVIKNFNESYGIFFCDKKNSITNENCEPEKEICPTCMENTQKMYGLKPHYLINSKGRVCTYKKNKIYCLGKFSRMEDDNKEKNKIMYSINYVCGHSGQCNSCKSMTEKMEKYFGSELMKKLQKRDKKLM